MVTEKPVYAGYWPTAIAWSMVALWGMLVYEGYQFAQKGDAIPEPSIQALASGHITPRVLVTAAAFMLLPTVWLGFAFILAVIGYRRCGKPAPILAMVAAPVMWVAWAVVCGMEG